MTFLRTENERSLSRALMNYFVRIHTIMLVTTNFAQLAILYVFFLRGRAREIELIFFIFRLIFYLSQMKLVTTKMERMHAELVKCS